MLGRSDLPARRAADFSARTASRDASAAVTWPSSAKAKVPRPGEQVGDRAAPRRRLAHRRDQRRFAVLGRLEEGSRPARRPERRRA